MEKLNKNNILFIIIDFICILCIFLFLLNHFKYAIVVNDDMSDIVSYDFYVTHGRYVTIFISQLFIKFIPLFLNINIQDFAIISEDTLKVLSFVLLIYIIGKLFEKSDYLKFKTPVYLLSYFVIFSILKKLDFIWCFDTSEWFHGYITPLIIYFILWKKLFDYYVKEIPVSKKDCIILSILAICNTTCNEEVNISFFILLALLLIEKILKKIEKSRGREDFLLVILISVIIFSSIVVFSSYGVQRLWEGYGLQLSFIPSKDIVINFLHLFISKIFIENIFFWFPFLCSSLIIIFMGRNNNYHKKVLKYVCYSISGFLIFLLSTIFLPANCYTDIRDEYKFWFLHVGLLACFNIFLFIAVLFLSIYVSENIKNKKIQAVNLFVLLVFCCSCIYLHFGRIICMPAIKEIKKMLFMDDKMTVFYLKKGRTVVLPKEQPIYILPDVPPEDLAQNKEIYSKIYDKERARYLIYIEKNYNVNVSSGGGITFKPYHEAMSEYIKNGGTFTDEELEKLDFSQIGK